MEFDLGQLSNHDRYKLLTGVVVPRPIALVTTVNQAGQFNAAPYSFFNAMGSDPPVVVIGVGNRQPGEPKDTAHNIRLTREFVVNLVNEAMAEQMNITAIDFPPEVDDLAMAGLTPVASNQVQAPRIAESPVNLECREIVTLNLGQTRVVGLCRKKDSRTGNPSHSLLLIVQCHKVETPILLMLGHRLC